MTVSLGGKCISLLTNSVPIIIAVKEIVMPINHPFL
jgi:hypothetical protein